MTKISPLSDVVDRHGFHYVLNELGWIAWEKGKTDKKYKEVEKLIRELASHIPTL